jgi:hypothetical protein
MSIACHMFHVAIFTQAMMVIGTCVICELQNLAVLSGVCRIPHS